MLETDPRIERFLATACPDHGELQPIAGDASARRYARVTRADGMAAILMDAGPESADEIGRFVLIAEHLRKRGLSAPAILNQAAAEGLLLVEDLGTSMVDRFVSHDPGSAADAYLCSAETLRILQPAPWPPGLEVPDARTLAERTRPAFDWYLGALRGQSENGRFRAISDALAEALDRYAYGPKALSLRDFHAGNLVWMPGRSGVARLGLLDFQDAFVGHPAYDLVSLLRDVRLDVPPGLASQVRRRFADVTGIDMAELEAASAVLAVQRNLRILGIFARLARRDGKTGYLAHLPRAWRLLSEDLTHPALGPLRDLVLTDFPAPDGARAAVP